MEKEPAVRRGLANGNATSCVESSSKGMLPAVPFALRSGSANIPANETGVTQRSRHQHRPADELLELRSTEKTYMASVSCQQLEDQLIALWRQNSTAESTAPIAAGDDRASINVCYAITRELAPYTQERTP